MEGFATEEEKKSLIVNVLATGQFKETSGSGCFSVARTARTLNCRDASSNPSFFCISQTVTSGSLLDRV